jgi:hypothetical protein
MARTQNIESLRNLRQYKDLSDDQFYELMARKDLDLAPVKEFEDRIARKIAEFGEDYDLSDMKFNDKETLRALAQVMITLEDMETFSYKLRSLGINEESLLLYDKVSNQLKNLRSDISSLQDTLKISRKVRKGDKEESVINFIDDLKDKAKRFYESKMSYIFCPECSMLLGTIWTLYPNSKNKISLTCGRILDNGHKCNAVVTVTTKELLDKRGSNKPEIMPESMR